MHEQVDAIHNVINPLKLVAECVKHFGDATKTIRKAALESLDGFRYIETFALLSAQS
jgi:hypothetical protein